MTQRLKVVPSSVAYDIAKVDLNMNPACSALLCMNGADARFCLLTLHTQHA